MPEVASHPSATPPGGTAGRPPTTTRGRGQPSRPDTSGDCSPSAIIVSHGQPSAPDPAEAVLSDFATQVARALPGWHVGAATLAKPGALDAALAEAGPGARIYPMFMTEGWFTREALRKRLESHEARVLPPFGRDPSLPAMAADLIAGVLRDKGWQAGETRIFIAAHGSGRSPNSALNTRAFRDALAEITEFAEIRVGFVEEPPYLADEAFDLGAKSICLPFFAAKGGHVIDDIPEALELAQFEGVLLDPLGCAPAAPGVVAAALREASA